MGVTVLMLVGVDLIDIQYRFSLLLPGLHPCLATTHNFVPNSSFLQFLDVSRAVPGLHCLFLVVEQSLLHPTGCNHPAHLTPLSSSNTAAILPSVLERANHGAHIFGLEPALCLCQSKSRSAWLSQVIQCPNAPGAGGYRGLEPL